MGSRIFVRGLPPSLTEDDFRKHFARGTDVTDLQLKPQRRIGYVGFKTPEAAAKAVKFFHKSFIRMSRLHVELAQEISQAQKANRAPTSMLPNSLNGATTQQMELPNSLKRKRVESQPGLSNVGANVHATIQDNYAAHGPAKSFAPSKAAERAAGNLDPNETSETPLPQDDGLDTKMSTEESLSQDNGDTSNTTDVDWMRSRTTRLLGLVEEDSEKEDVVSGGNNGGLGRQSMTEEDISQSKASNEFHGDSPLHRGQESSTKPQADDDDKKSLPSAQSIDGALDSGRLFLRNLAYNVTESDLRSLLGGYGVLQEVHVPLDFQSGGSKGFAFIQYGDPASAKDALEHLDGTDFQGRLLHVLPASAKRDSKPDEFAIAQLPLKKRKLMEKKTQSASTTFNWNSMYMNADAVVTSAAARLGIPKSEVLDPTSSDAAVKQAQVETHTIQEAKRYFETNGVHLDSLNQGTRDGDCLLVKNFKYETTAEDLEKLFSEGGDVKRVLMPPSGTIAIVEFPNKVQAKTALTKFAYRKFKDSVLFLERAPSNLFNQVADVIKKNVAKQTSTEETNGTLGGDETVQDSADERTESSTLFVRNLSFDTTSQGLHNVFKPLEGFLSARVKTRPDPKHEDQLLSMGFGFLEFKTNDQARAAFLAMNGYLLDGHKLQIKASHKGVDAAAERRREDSVKRQKQRKSRIIIKNLPFEASKKDVRNLFGSYGQVKAVRLPKTSGNSSRGYAFADFTNVQQAERAMELGRTHLLGRKLVLEYAAGDFADPEKEIEKMQRKIGRQSDSLALQQLTANERRKFNTSDGGEEEG